MFSRVDKFIISSLLRVNFKNNVIEPKNIVYLKRYVVLLNILCYEASINDVALFVRLSVLLP